MSIAEKRLGRSGENLAAHYLHLKGYKILERNYRNRLGEIDIIAEHKGVLVFVEVKTRRSRRYGHPKWAITPAKQRHMQKTALVYLKEKRRPHTRARFDVVTVEHSCEPPHIEVISNAFEIQWD